MACGLPADYVRTAAVFLDKICVQQRRWALFGVGAHFQICSVVNSNFDVDSNMTMQLRSHEASKRDCAKQTDPQKCLSSEDGNNLALKRTPLTIVGLRATKTTGVSSIGAPIKGPLTVEDLKLECTTRIANNWMLIANEYELKELITM